METKGHTAEPVRSEPPPTYFGSPMPGPAPVSTTTHVIYAGPPPVGRQSASVVCPHCHVQITTSVTKESGLSTWLVAGGLCLVGCWLGCCLIPFCIDDLKDTEHTCPNCRTMVGIHKPIA